MKLDGRKGDLQQSKFELNSSFFRLHEPPHVATKIAFRLDVIFFGTISKHVGTGPAMTCDVGRDTLTFALAKDVREGAIKAASPMRLPGWSMGSSFCDYEKSGSRQAASEDIMTSGVVEVARQGELKTFQFHPPTSAKNCLFT